MFWGGEFSSGVTLSRLDRSRRVTNVNSNSNSNESLNRAIFEAKIASGIPGSSRCGWALLCAQGRGPLKQKLKGKAFLKSLFQTSWERFYLSLDGQTLRLFLAKNSLAAFYAMPLTAVANIRVELALSSFQTHRPKVDNPKLLVMEDPYLVALETEEETIQLMSLSSPLRSSALLCSVCSSLSHSSLSLFPLSVSVSVSAQVSRSSHERDLGEGHHHRSEPSSFFRVVRVSSVTSFTLAQQIIL
jgi:hypothetical protein